jgi:ABC-type bacteriocin/lantibiotic exporter with double-glycine peptidase domain
VPRSTPPFYKQETRYSCAPTCLRMVLSALGLDMEEASLQHLTDCTPLGTEAFQVLEAARHLGFPASRTYTLTSLDELASVVASGAFPMVYVDVWPLQGGRSGQAHALVVVATFMITKSLF